MIEINDVSFEYEKTQGTLEHINLQISQGECVLLCGESGCGKTTITKLINGLIPHFVEGGRLLGTTRVLGMEVANVEMYKLSMAVGSVFQNPKSQFFNIDSDSEIAFGLENAGLPIEKMRERFDGTVSALHIQPLLDRNIFSMSGGEKQALAFASVYAMNPKIFVLDEPTANLDEAAINILRRQLAQIKSEGRTIIIAEHRLYFLTDFIDRAVFLQKGRITRIFTREEFMRLTEKERISMGLRSLKPARLSLPGARTQLPESAKIQSLQRTETRPFRRTNTQLPGETGLCIEALCCDIDHRTVFKDINFCAKQGEAVGIIGHNGAGKTTLTRCLCGLIKEKSGTIRLDGKALNRRQRNKASFCVMQDVNHQLFADSVWNECELAVQACSENEIKEVLSAFGLLAFKDRHPMSLSGGQKQRLAVATAVLSGKRLLVFDEPTSGLDYRRMIEVSAMIRRLCDSQRIVLVVSHDFEFLSCTCDKIFDMEEGG